MKEQTTIRHLEPERLPPESENATTTDVEVREDDRRTIAAALAAQLKKLSKR